MVARPRSPATKNPGGRNVVRFLALGRTRVPTLSRSSGRALRETDRWHADKLVLAAMTFPNHAAEGWLSNILQLVTGPGTHCRV